jgi:quinol monooxygenase YgiN
VPAAGNIAKRFNTLSDCIFFNRGVPYESGGVTKPDSAEDPRAPNPPLCPVGAFVRASNENIGTKLTTKGETHMVKLALWVRLEAKQGKETEVENFLKSGLAIVEGEPATTAWFAIRMSRSTFGIFDAFPDESGRQAHLTGRVAAALKEKTSELLASPPSIEKFDVLAAKLPGQAARAGA